MTQNVAQNGTRNLLSDPTLAHLGARGALYIATVSDLLPFPTPIVTFSSCEYLVNPSLVRFFISLPADFELSSHCWSLNSWNLFNASFFADSGSKSLDFFDGGVFAFLC